MPDLVVREAEAAGDLPAVDVEPLGGDLEVDAAVLGGGREAGFGAEEGLILHPDLVLAAHDDVRRGERVAVADVDVPHDVAAGMEVRSRRP